MLSLRPDHYSSLSIETQLSNRHSHVQVVFARSDREVCSTKTEGELIRVESGRFEGKPNSRLVDHSLDMCLVSFNVPTNAVSNTDEYLNGYAMVRSSSLRDCDCHYVRNWYRNQHGYFVENPRAITAGGIGASVVIVLAEYIRESKCQIRVKRALIRYAGAALSNEEVG